MQRRSTATAWEFQPQNVANVLWALATMGERADPGLLEAMQRRATATAWEWTPQHVGNVLWALATMGERADRVLLEAMQWRATATAGEFKPKEVANVLWALATMGEKAGGGMLEAMQRWATALAREFNPQDVGNVLWALATMGERADRGLLQAIGRRATATAGEFQPQNIANVMWALATMGEKPDRGVLEAIGVRAIATAGEFNSQDVGNVLWALAVMGEVFTGFPVALIDLFASHVLESRDLLNLKEKAQLHQWLLSHELDLVSGASLSSSVARVKQEIGEECLQAFTGQGSSESRLQRDVAAELKRVWSEVEMEEEYRDARSGYSIDVLVRRRSAAGSTEWAVEVDGPSHFLADARTPSGSTLLKRKQLGQLGYTVVPVPFWEWDALRGEEAKRRYLEDKL
ncbi:RAP domain-containing protein, partial [Baffinella frigidus]